MERRRILAGTGTALSSLTTGCLDLDSVFRSTRGDRELSLSTVDNIDDDHPIKLRVILQSKAMGAETTPSLRILLETTAAEPQFIGYSEVWPADALLPSRDTVPPGIRFLSDGEYSDLTVEEGPCPTTEYRPVHGDGSTGHRVSPGMEYSEQYFAVGSSTHLPDGCPEPGHYQVRSTYSYTAASEVEDVGWENADREQFTWGFEFEVADVH